MKFRAQARKRVDVGVAGLAAIVLLLGAQQVGQKASAAGVPASDLSSAASWAN